jgi:hypothetical protein
VPEENESGVGQAQTKSREENRAQTGRKSGVKSGANPQFREALVEGWDKLQRARDRYRASVGPAGMHAGLIRRFVETQVAISVMAGDHISDRWRPYQ